jgi:hypothetical protein
MNLFSSDFDNVLALGAMADFGAQNCQYTIPKVFGIDVRKNGQLTKSPAIEPNAC